MNVFQRIWISLKRKFGTIFLLFLLTFILGSVVVGTILVSQAVLNVEESLRRNLPPVATLELHLPYDFWDGFEWDSNESFELDHVTLDLIYEIADLPYVAEMDHSFHSFWESPIDSGIIPVTLGDILPTLMDDLTTQHIRRPDFIDLNTGLISLVEGRNFTEEEINVRSDIFPVLISSKLADLNQLSVGSIFYLESVLRGEFLPDGSILGIEETGRFQFEFEVIGIFELAREIVAGGEWENDYSTFTILNRLYTPAWVAVEVSDIRELFLYEKHDWWEIQEPYQDTWLQLAFLLYDPFDLPTFEDAANELLPNYWEVITLSNAFATISGTAETISRISEIIIWFVVSVAIVVLTLVVMLILRERKYEIGVYLALGERRWKVILQLMLEVLTIGIVAIALSLGSGSILARTSSEYFLRQQLIYQEELRVQQKENTSFSPLWDPLHWFSPGAPTIEEMMEQYEVILDAEVITWFSSVSILVLVVSSIIPTIYILRFSPKEILMSGKTE